MTSEKTSEKQRQLMIKDVPEGIFTEIDALKCQITTNLLKKGLDHKITKNDIYLCFFDLLLNDEEKREFIANCIEKKIIENKKNP